MATASISFPDLDHNLQSIRSYLKPASRILVAIKANAYGHGAVAMAKELERLGIDYFGVATATEALELRQAGLDTPILIFSPVYDAIPELIDQAISLTVVDEHSLELIQRQAHKPARLHLKVDTGMGRLGQDRKTAISLAQRIDSDRDLILHGVWTHFASSDDAIGSYTQTQLEEFNQFLADLSQQHIPVNLVHAANSAAIFAYPESHFDMVRPGIAVYGYHSSPYIASLEPSLKPILTLTAPVTFVKRVKAGTSISYSGLWQAKQDTTIATVRIGYADGYPRLLTGKARVLVHNQLCPIAGRICMDQLMVDVGNMEVAVGDTVTLFGSGELTAEMLGASIGTISYELLTSLSPRVERRYLH